MGQAKNKRVQAAISPQPVVDDVVFSKQMTLPQRVTENAIGGFDGFWRMLERTRANPSIIKGAKGAWEPWCYVPVNVVIGIATHILKGEVVVDPSSPGWISKLRMLCAVSAWRMTKGVYVFDPLVAEAIFDSDVEEDFPDELFLHLPEWCPYISTPGLEIKKGLFIKGFFAYVDDHNYANHHQTPELNFEILIDTELSSDEELLPMAMLDPDVKADVMSDLEEIGEANKPSPDEMLNIILKRARDGEYVHMHMNVPIGQGKFSKAFFNQTVKNANAIQDSFYANTINEQGSSDAMQEVSREFGILQARLGALLMYMVSDKADMSSKGGSAELREKIVVNERMGIRNYEARTISPWDVGFRIGAELRAFKESNKNELEFPGSGTRPRPHVRRAHWHSFWTGPRDQPEHRRKKVRWLPPTPVNVTCSDDLVPTMHKVITESVDGVAPPN